MLELIIILFVVGGIVYGVLDNIRRSYERKSKEEEQKRKIKRKDLYELMETDVLNENKMGLLQKNQILDPVLIDPEDTEEALHNYNEWVWVQRVTFDRCLRQYPQYFDKEHKSEFDDMIEDKYEQFKEFFPEIKRNTFWYD